MEGLSDFQLDEDDDIFASLMSIDPSQNQEVGRHDWLLGEAANTLMDVKNDPDAHHMDDAFDFMADDLGVEAMDVEEMPEVPIPDIYVSNIVCQSVVNTTLNLDLLEPQLPNISRTSAFPALFMRLKEPTVTLLIFGNGKVLACGGKCLEEAHTAFNMLIDMLHREGYTEAVLGPVVVQNIVAKIDMGFPIQISKLVQHPLHRRYCQTQGKQFPCVNYRLKTVAEKRKKNTHITVRIFGNGAVGFQSCTRLTKKVTSMEQLEAAVRHMLPVFYHYRSYIHQPIEPLSLLPHLNHMHQFTEQ